MKARRNCNLQDLKDSLRRRILHTVRFWNSCSLLSRCVDFCRLRKKSLQTRPKVNADTRGFTPPFRCWAYKQPLSSIYSITRILLGAGMCVWGGGEFLPNFVQNVCSTSHRFRFIQPNQTLRLLRTTATLYFDYLTTKSPHSGLH
jgi:hypothetical protein